MGIIFDLDQTLIESSPAERLRRARNWQAVYRMIPDLRPYEGISDMLTELNQQGVPVCIVTSSPKPYCEQVISRWKWKIDATVCYHDTSLRKPHPAPILLGIKKMNVPMEKVVVVGDDVRDIVAAKSAGVMSVGVLWGAHNKGEVVKSNPSKVFDRVNELREFLLEYYL